MTIDESAKLSKLRATENQRWAEMERALDRFNQSLARFEGWVTCEAIRVRKLALATPVAEDSPRKKT